MTADAAQPPDALLSEVRDLMGVPALALDDDLFAAGMTSLHAIRIARALSAHNGRKIPVRDIYRKRRLSELAAAAAPADPPAPPTPPAPPAPDSGHHPLTHAQKRFLFAEALTPGTADNIVVEAYELTGPLRPEVLRAALDDVVARHPGLRTVYPWEGGQPVQRLLSGQPVPWSAVPPPPAGAGLAARELAHRVMADLWETPFRLDRELPVRARLCVLGPERALLCLQFHHIGFDGASEPTLLADLDVAYAARARGDAPRFSPAPSYRLLGQAEERDLATWAAADLAYWRETLADCPPPCLPPPGKGSGTDVPSRESVRHLDGAAVRRLAGAAARCGGPVLSALAAGAAMALSRRFDAPDVCVGTVTAGRFDPATEGLVGHLVNAFALPLHGVRRGAEPVLADAARRVTNGLAHARTPFDELVRELRPDRERHPWFEAWVVLQHAHPDVPLGPVTVRSLRVTPPRTSRCWTAEAMPAAGGGWELVTTWREDVMTGETGEALADDLVAALLEIIEIIEITAAGEQA